jgi:hypothetical protein
MGRDSQACIEGGSHDLHGYILAGASSRPV